LQESGFVHSSFTFVYESMLGRSNMRNAERSIPPGALISFLQKGLHYVGIEESLQREQQRGNASNSNKRNKTGNSTNSNNSSNASMPGGASLDGALNLSLLSPATISALTRENPPLHLNVPPATAAAAVRARLEAEAQIEADRKKVAILEAQEKVAAQSNGKSSTRLAGPQSIPPQTSVNLPNPLANSATSTMNMQAAQAAAAMSQLQQQQHHHLLSPQNSPLTQQQHQQAQSQQQKTADVESAGAAAALLAQQRIAEIAIMEDQRRRQLQQLQLQEQEKLHLQKLHQAAAQVQAQNQSGHNPMESISGMNTAHAQEAAILASVAEQMGNNMNNNSNNNNNTGSGANSSNNNKRASSAKKGPKNKGKSSKQQRTAIAPQQQHIESVSGPTQQSEATMNSTTALSSNTPLTALQNSGFAAIEEAVSRLEAAASKKAPKHQQQYQQQQQRQQDVVMSDAQQSGAVGEESDHHPHHRHLQHRHLQHHPQTNNILSHMQISHAELSSQQAAAVQDLMTMNGNHGQGERHSFNSGTTEQQKVPNGALSSPILEASVSASAAQQQAVTTAAGTSQIVPKEAAKAVDAIIDREDELTNAKVSEVLELKMHQSEVFMCAWNSVFTDMIATGSGDASARIWKMGGPKATHGLGPVKLLPHGTGPRDRKNKDVTTLEWSSDGKLLATGSYDGVARVWGLNGALVHTLRGHKGPIFSLKWNKTGNYLLSGSYDKTTIVWDVSSGSGFIKQQFEDHQAPALDVDWKDDDTFASCSTDKTVHICRVGSERPLKTYSGHTDEVNAVKWDPSGSLLASCSDDCTAKVWDVNSDSKEPMYDFKSHQQEIYTVKW
jgi:hypothetical protein